MWKANHPASHTASKIKNKTKKMKSPITRIFVLSPAVDKQSDGHEHALTAGGPVAPHHRRRNARAGTCLLLCRLAPFFLPAQQRVFHRGGDPSRTQLCGPSDELHWNRFSQWKMDRPFSPLIAPECIFERREER